MDVSFIVPGRIGGKGRPRFTVRGGFARAYTPAKTANAEAMVRSLAAEAMNGRPPLAGPVILDVLVTLNTPASWSKKRAAAATNATGKPDVDNVAKLIGDALNGIVWSDDSQICELHLRRRYDNSTGEQVRIQIGAAL